MKDSTEQILSTYISCTISTTLNSQFPHSTINLNFYPQHNLPSPGDHFGNDYRNDILETIAPLIQTYPYNPSLYRLHPNLKQAGGGSGYGYQKLCSSGLIISSGSGSGGGFDSHSFGAGGGGGTQVYNIMSELIASEGGGGGCGSEGGEIVCCEKRDDDSLKENLEVECNDWIVHGGGGGGGGYSSGSKNKGFGYGFSFTVKPQTNTDNKRRSLQQPNSHYVEALKKYNPTGLMFINASEICGGYQDWSCVCENVKGMGGLVGVDCDTTHKGDGEGDNQFSGKSSHIFNPKVDLPKKDILDFCNALIDNDDFCGLGSIGIEISGCDVSFNDDNVPSVSSLMSAINPNVNITSSNYISKIVVPCLAVIAIMLTFAARRSLRRARSYRVIEEIEEVEVNETSRLFRPFNEVYI